MEKLEIDQTLFCPKGKFLDQVVDILCNHNGIFQASTKSLVEFFYDDMRQKINNNQYLIYPLPGCSVQNKIDDSLLKSNGHYYAGHDLPVWLNDPSKTRHRLLVVSQDPRRNVDEMKNKEVGISTPFGLHSMVWRSKKSQGLIHWVVDKLLNRPEFMNSLSVYYTDVYKFRGVDDKSNNIDSTLDKKNSDIYYKIFKNEIDLFNPTVILLMGDKAKEAYRGVRGNSDKDKELKIPHPSPNAIKKWSEVLNEFKTNKKCTSDNKIEYIYERLLEKLRIKILTMSISY